MFLLIGTSAVIAQDQSTRYPEFKVTLDAGNFPKVDFNSESELEELLEAQKLVTDGLLQEIKYWNAAYPSYCSHQMMAAAGNRSENRKMVLVWRFYTLLFMMH
jgi:hypothetical protein